MAVKLQVWNAALVALGSDRLSDTGDPIESARELTAAYDRVVADCLEAGSWDFAMETLAATASGSNEFGYTHVFSKPSTWLATEVLAQDANFLTPLLAYYEDSEVWAADTGHLWVRYLSNDTGKGLGLAGWGSAFTRYVELELAHRVCIKLTQDPALQKYVGEERDKAKAKADIQDSFKLPWPTFDTDTNTRARIIHSALIELGDMGKVAVAGEDPRRILNRLYDEAVAECLAAASWNFATETVKLDADTGLTPEFGYAKVFAKPSDWVRTYAVSEDEHFSYPLIRYYDDQSFWSSDNTPIYVRYVSNDTGMGLELTRWTPLFTRYVVLELALRASAAVTSALMAQAMAAGSAQPAGSRTIDYARASQVAERAAIKLTELRDKARTTAKNQDAMDEANPKFTPPNSWTVSRWGGRGGWRDRGSRGSLIG